ncbi:MAG: MBL fold metallo-hydrolase [Burkholderiales bacterium]
MKIALLLLSAMFSLSAAAQADRFDKVQIKTTQLTKNIYMLEGEGGNIGVSAGEDGVLLVDDQFGPLTERILAAIKAITDKPVRFVVNTHWHFDHTSGNANFSQAGAVIIAQENLRKRLLTEQRIEFFKKPYGPLPPAARPTITFRDAVTLHFNGDEVTAFHAPRAHTDGDSIVHFPGANVLHMGDIYFAGIYPFIDYGTGGSIRGFIAAVDRALKIADDNTKIIPGHGPLSDKAQLQAYRNMLVKVSAHIRVMVKAKKTLAQVIAAKPTKVYDDAWGKGFLKPDQFAEVVYTSIAREK